MKHADLNDLEKVVADAVKSSLTLDAQGGFAVALNEHDGASEVIRVLVYFDDLRTLSDEQVDTITDEVERAVSRFDDRFPSVRFLER